MSGFLRKSYRWLTVIYRNQASAALTKKRLKTTQNLASHLKAGYSEQKAYLRPVQDSILLRVTSEPSPSVVLCNFQSARTVQRWNRSRPRNLAGRDSLAV